MIATLLLAAQVALQTDIKARAVELGCNMAPKSAFADLVPTCVSSKLSKMC